MTVEVTNLAIEIGELVGANEDKVIMLLRQLERILAKLKHEGKIARHGASKNGYWEVL
jgi:hypothetical protein